jgi:two-component system LytT family response regulator
MIKAIIVDDEPNCCKTLSILLNRYCPEVEVTGTYYNGIEALQAINTTSPNVVFLDVEMPKMNGFEMLEKLPSVNFHLIFTTSYDQYALKAFRFSAIDYLLKPVDREELQKAVKKVSERFALPIAEQLQILLQKVNHPGNPVNKIALPTMEGLQMVLVESILYCESDDNYTILILKNNTKLVVSRTLKEVEEMLEEYSFVRVHRSYLVNINEIEKYIKGEGGYLLMTNGAMVDVSRNKKEVLLKKLMPYKPGY